MKSALGWISYADSTGGIGEANNCSGWWLMEAVSCGEVKWWTALLRQLARQLVHAFHFQSVNQSRIKRTTKHHILVRVDKKVRMDRAANENVLLERDLPLMCETHFSEPLPKDDSKAACLIDLQPCKDAICEASVHDVADIDAVLEKQRRNVAVAAVEDLWDRGVLKQRP